MKSINKQILCMRKLNVPEKMIQDVLKKHKNERVLLTKLIECEEKYSSIGKEKIEKGLSIFQSKYMDADLSFDLNDLTEADEVDLNKSTNWKIQLIQGLSRFPREIISWIALQEFKAEIKNTKIYEIIKRYKKNDRMLINKLKKYSELLEAQYGF